jgi:hypothetical protein
MDCLQHGPWDVVVDGANVGMNAQNYPGVLQYA